MDDPECMCFIGFLFHGGTMHFNWAVHTYTKTYVKVNVKMIHT